MVIVRTRGGLGNQIFQYVYAEYIKSLSAEVYVDTSEFDVFQCHDGLEVEKIFDINIPKARNRDIISLANYIPIPIGGLIGYKLFLWMSAYEKKRMESGKKDTHLFEREIKQMSFDDFKKIVLTKNVYMDGYWTDNYYDKIDGFKLRFREEYIQKYKKYDGLMDYDHSCSIHIRLGDYVGTHFDVCKQDYYKQAMEYILDIDKDTVFYVFSNDSVGAKELLGDITENIVFVDTHEEKTAGLDMWLMSKCTNNIIANSTYSLWAAKLNENVNKIVVMPQVYTNYAWDKCVII